jgi:uncharacterized alkaline shock family protein YloU
MSEVLVSTDVISGLVSSAASGIEGIAGFTGGALDTLNETLRGKENPYKGIRIAENNGVYDIDVYVTVKYGTKIPELAWHMQKQIKERLDEILEIKLGDINIHIQGVEKDS